MKLEVLGSGCANCQTLKATTEEALRELGITDIEVAKVEDFPTIMSYGVMATPALVIDGTVVSSGRVLSKDEVTQLIVNALAVGG